MIENYNENEEYINVLASSEIWFDVKFDGVHNNRYSISTFGRLNDGCNIFKSSYSSTNGHDYDLISINGKLKLIPVEVLMVSTFYKLDIQTIYKDIKIIHKDDDLTNNSLSNLNIVKADECWHIIDVYNIKADTYEVSNFGRVRNIKTGLVSQASIDRTELGVKCYSKISFIRNNGDKANTVAQRLVAEYFVDGKTNERTMVNHIDGNRQNNHYMNLEWVTPQNNTQHAVLTGLIPVGEKSKASKHSDFVIELVCRLLLKYDGDIRKVKKELKLIALDISYRCIQHVRLCHSRTDISSKYFNKERFLNSGMRYEDRPVGEDSSTSKISNAEAHNICSLLIKHFGNALWVHRNLIDDDITHISLRTINHIKNKECWSHISDEYFTKEYLKKLEIHKIEIICETLVKNNMDINNTYEELKDSMRYLITRFIADIRHKHTYTEISKLYF